MQITPGIRGKERDDRQTAALFDPPKYTCEHQEKRGDVELIKGRSLAADVAKMENHGNAVNAVNAGNARERRERGVGPIQVPCSGILVR